jgi:hypothetical protein
MPTTPVRRRTHGRLAAERTQPSTRVAGLLWATTSELSSGRIPAVQAFARSLPIVPAMERSTVRQPGQAGEPIQSMQHSEIGEALVNALPELSADLAGYRAEWTVGPERPGPYNISCDVLFPALKRWLESGDSNDQLRRTFLVLEQLANEPDQEVHYWVNDVAEWLTQETQWLKAAQPFFGPHFGRLVRRRWYECFGTSPLQRWFPPWR